MTAERMDEFAKGFGDGAEVEERGFGFDDLMAWCITNKPEGVNRLKIYHIFNGSYCGSYRDDTLSQYVGGLINWGQNKAGLEFWKELHEAITEYENN